MALQKTGLISLLLMSTTIQLPAQTIGSFNSVKPAGQAEQFVLPPTHTFQRIIRAGEKLPSGETISDNFDFSCYVPLSGSSTRGYLSISSEQLPAGVAILSVSFNSTTKLWEITGGGNVPFPFDELGKVNHFCGGTLTPAGHVMVCEEHMDYDDGNGDGYADDGWIVEIDPVSRTVVNQDGVGGADKLWAMGRQRHEDIAIKNDGTVAYWSADNASDGYVYKFVPAVAGKYAAGDLYVLKTTKALGTGTWERVANTSVEERNRTVALSVAAGGYNFKRVEGIEIGPDGKVYFPSTTTGEVFRFRDLGATVDQLEVFVKPANFDVDGTGPFPPEPWGTGADNLAFDGEGNLWVLQDGGRRHIWVVGKNHSADHPDVRLFGNTPAGAEPTGITFSPDYKFLFISFQHPNASNKASQVDATGKPVIFNNHTALVIARKEHLGSLLQAPLPVRFISFSVQQKNGVVELSWTIAPGLFPDHFEVERSADGERFTSIANVTPGGEANSFLDPDIPPAAALFYRVKAVETNGRTSYTQVKSVRPAANAGVLILYPVPASDQLIAEYRSGSTGKVRLTIHNTAGAVVQEETVSLNRGINRVPVNLAALPKGNYLLTIGDGGSVSRMRFVKQ